MTFDQGYNENQDKNNQNEKPVINVAVLASTLRSEYDDAQKARNLIELRWIEDLRQYKGLYEPSILKRMEKSKRSKFFYRMTTAKVNTMTAKLEDLLFPQRTKNWNINPTPDPMLPDDVIMFELKEDIQAFIAPKMNEVMQGLAANQIEPDQEAIMNFQKKFTEEAFQELNTQGARARIAKERSQKMEAVINDQLKESNSNGQRTKSWQGSCKKVFKDSCLYGMGVFKGPLVQKVEKKRFTTKKDEDGNATWQEEIYSSEIRPYYEAVSLWDIFPDPAAKDPTDLRYVWQVRMMIDKDLLALKDFPQFKKDVIAEYINTHPDGDASLQSWEAQRRDLNEDNQNGGAIIKNRYRVYERWGFLSGRELADCGADISEENYSHVYSSNVWMIGDKIIKAVINPLEGVDIPYYFFPYQDDDSSFWPEGIASMLRAPQTGINSTVRAMQDNSTASSGPIWGINMHYLSEGEDPFDMMANKVFLFDKSNANLSQAMQAVTVPSCIEHNLALSNFWQNGADEMSTPRFNSGDGNIAGAGKTASGLSMLMGAANILLKDHIKSFDENIISPFIRAMFLWNMKWNTREDIKGDFEVVAVGSQSMIAKEVRAQQVPMLLNYLSIPQFTPYIRAEKLLEVALEQTDLPAERILRTEEEAKRYEKELAMQQAAMQVEAIMAELQKQGLSREQVQANLMMMLAQSQGATNEQ